MRISVETYLHIGSAWHSETLFFAQGEIFLLFIARGLGLGLGLGFTGDFCKTGEGGLGGDLGRDRGERDLEKGDRRGEDRWKDREEDRKDLGEKFSFVSSSPADEIGKIGLLIELRGEEGYCLLMDLPKLDEVFEIKSKLLISESLVKERIALKWEHYLTWLPN